MSTPPNAATALAITADSECPQASTTDAILLEILGLPVGARLEESAELVHAGASLSVRLRGKDARLLGERALPLEGSCAELARAAAVVLATWLNNAHPEFVPRLLPGDAPVTGADGVVSGVPALDRRVPPPPVPPPLVGHVEAHGTLRPRDSFRARVALELGVGALPTPPAFTAKALAAWVPPESGIGAALRAGVTSARSVAVDAGTARYFRWPLGAGALLRVGAPKVATEFEAGLELAWLHVAGRSFSPNRSVDTATAGPCLAARVMAKQGIVLPFVEVTSTYWLRSARVYGDPSRPSVALPQFELGALLGAALVP